MRLQIHHWIYFVLLFVLACAQPVSNYLMSATQVLLFANWFLEWDMRRKFERAKQQPLLLLFLTLAAVHIVWLVPSDNLQYGLDDLFKKLPLLAIPLVILTSERLSDKKRGAIVAGYIITVFITTIVGRVRYNTIPDLPYREIIPYISHIRFALNVCMALVFLVWFDIRLIRRMQNNRQGDKGRLPFANIILIIAIFAVALSLLQFLFLIRSYTAIIILPVCGLVLLVAFWKQIKPRLLRLTAAGLYTVATAVLVVSIATQVHSYYDMIPLANEPLAAATAGGRPYLHEQDGLIENGNYVNNYICREELESEWAKVSRLSLSDTTLNGYAISPTLIRWLNARGVTKDSAGMQVLSTDDVKSIEKGIANPVYREGSQIKRMVYVMLYEYESYRHLHVVKDFTMLQRFELWKNAFRVFRSHPLFGVGTGDVVDCCHEQLVIDNSPMAGTKKHAHNQYITFLVSFGIVGFIIIAAVFVWAMRKSRLLRNPVALAYIVILLISFVAEDTLETLAGVVFSTYFFCFLQPSEKNDCDKEAAL